MALGGVLGASGHDLRVITVRGEPMVIELVTLDFQMNTDTRGQLVSLEVRKANAIRFLRGAWLEGYLYNKIREAIGERNDVQIAANLGIAYRKDGGIGKQRISEIDVAIMVRSQLHIVDAKTASLTTKAARESGERAFGQIDSVKKAFLGQIGKVLIVNPRDSQGDAQIGDIDLRARGGGEELFLGHDAVTKAIARVRELVGAAGGAPTPTRGSSADRNRLDV